MPRYIKFEDVEARVRGKVRFADEPDDENAMSRQLAIRLIDEAEAQVEYDLSDRYDAPFRNVDDNRYDTLPASPTRHYLKTLCELLAVVRIVETDFGAGSSVDAEKYCKAQMKRYDDMVKRLLDKRSDATPGQWAKPPLPKLALSASNAQADDGFHGTILSTSQGDGAFPQKQITDPSESFINGTVDE